MLYFFLKSVKIIAWKIFLKKFFPSAIFCPSFAYYL